ncbi:MAG: Crp/Fnr family transcriptional regulator [Agathobacter sp.]|nr:Crp/Fnr family transcriptional regulator [Agathobacter sp.]
MVAIQLKKGEHLVRKGESTKAIYIILKGSVVMKTEYNQITLDSGSIIGIMYGYTDEYMCDYEALEDSLIASYKYESPEDYKVIFEEQPKYCYAFLYAAIRQFRTVYDNYKALQDAAKELSDFITKQYSVYEMMCSEYGVEQKEVQISELSAIEEPEPMKAWEISYFMDLVDLPEKNLRYFYGDKENLTIGVLLQIAEIETRMIANMDALKEYIQSAKEGLLNEDEDLLELWYDLAVKLAVKEYEVDEINEKVQELEAFLKHTSFYKEDVVESRMDYYRSVDFKNYTKNHAPQMTDDENLDGEVAEEMTREQVLKTDFTTYIMKYAGYEQNEISQCKALIKEYAAIAEIQDYTPEMQKTRRALTKVFYEIYEKAFLRAVNARSISKVMKLFFNFGVLDLNMAGVSHLDELMAISELLDNQWLEQKQADKNGESICHVYTAYQWLCLVYRGEKEPSKNEFDVDYTGHLLEMRKNHEITREEENQLKRDQLKKVQFEIHNMFMTNNRITYGRITTFCPVLHEKDFIRTIDQLIVSLMTVNAAIDEIRELDYSCFFREVFFAAPKYGIERTEIMKEVLPDVILMPNIGTRAMMWQETAGVKRDTPARFIFPVMTSGELLDMMLETVGRYRWEICRKILGVRWNDIREKSLTSEFYDYVQFYRKNRDLSQEAKEKVKAELVHAKNNYREVFVSDYLGWMKYESQGNFRLNKVSRRIISEYVPFKPEVRKKLEENPMYRELFSKSNIIAGRKREKEKALFDRYVAAGGTITPELEAHLRYHGIQM